MSRAVSVSPRPPSPGLVLSTRRENDVARYLVLREALLALPGVVQHVVADGSRWTLAFRFGEYELARVRLAPRRARADNLRLMLAMPAGLRDDLSRRSELEPDTRRRVQRAEGEPPRCTLPITADEELTEAVGLALMVASRLSAAC